jgi:hypothetical protein
MICIFCNKECKNNNSLKNHQIRCRENPNRKVQRNGGSGGWNKGLTKEDDPRIGHSQQTKEKIRLANKNRLWTYQSEEFKEKQRQNALKRGLGGVTQSRWIVYNGKTLGSSYELEVAKSLDENGVTWDTCSKFYYIDRLNKKRSYTPDLYLIDYDVYLDPKNDFLINNINPALGFTDVEKINKVCEQNNVKIIILNKTQLNWDNIKKLL